MIISEDGKGFMEKTLEDAVNPPRNINRKQSSTQSIRENFLVKEINYIIHKNNCPTETKQDRNTSIYNSIFNNKFNI